MPATMDASPSGRPSVALAADDPYKIFEKGQRLLNQGADNIGILPRRKKGVHCVQRTPLASERGL
jgi:hypothetical protein